MKWIEGFATNDIANTRITQSKSLRRLAKVGEASRINPEHVQFAEVVERGQASEYPSLDHVIHMEFFDPVERNYVEPVRQCR